VNQEIIRAREITAELRLNNEKAHQLTHTLRNLLTIHQIRLEQIRATSGKTRQKIERRMHELAREYHETHDPEIPAEIYRLARQLKELDH
jgi:flagellin-specific chaperone FliS